MRSKTKSQSGREQCVNRKAARQTASVALSNHWGKERHRHVRCAVVTSRSHHIRKPNMYREETTTTTRLATEIIRCIAKTLLTKADELERLQDPTQTEPPRPRTYDPAYDL